MSVEKIKATYSLADRVWVVHDGFAPLQLGDEIALTGVVDVATVTSVDDGGAVGTRIATAHVSEFKRVPVIQMNPCRTPPAAEDQQS